VTHATVHHIDYGLPHRVQGAADRHFACAVRAFASLFPGRRFGGGALAVYLDGRPLVDVWTGYADRRGEQHWHADTGAMVFSATKGMTSTVIHRLVDRGLLSYDAPVAEYWPEFGANGKGRITVRDVMRHRAGLSHLHGVTREELMDHVVMEQRLAAARPDRLRGIPAYHALTYGWLMSGLARSVTGMGMRDLIRSELAQHLNTDGLHLGRPPADAATRVAQILTPQSTRINHIFNFSAPKIAALWFSGGFGAMYFPGMKAVVQGEIPFLDGELPSVNGVATARGLAKMYAAIANSGCIDGRRFLSSALVRDLTGKPTYLLDFNIIAPLSWHLGYHAVPGRGLPGFGHAGLGGSVGWADPSTGMSFGFVHNRLLTPMLVDQFMFAGLGALIRRGADAARMRGAHSVPAFGAPYPQPPDEVAG
jgi:CubicO group peptidase (beta-lactamase class C family)